MSEVWREKEEEEQEPEMRELELVVYYIYIYMDEVEVDKKNPLKSNLFRFYGLLLLFAAVVLHYSSVSILIINKFFHDYSSFVKGIKVYE